MKNIFKYARRNLRCIFLVNPNLSGSACEPLSSLSGNIFPGILCGSIVVFFVCKVSKGLSCNNRESNTKFKARPRLSSNAVFHHSPPPRASKISTDIYLTI